MSSIIRRTARTYLDRRTPWGPPWWVYAVTLGAANLVRQAVLWRTDAGSTVGLAAFVVMVLVVFGAVTGTATLLGRRDLRRMAAAGRRTGAADVVDRGGAGARGRGRRQRAAVSRTSPRRTSGCPRW